MVDGIENNTKMSYNALHAWVRKNKTKPLFCEECKINKPFELANISQEYHKNINDFRWLCRSCHKKETWMIKKEKDNTPNKIREVKTVLSDIQDKAIGWSSIRVRQSTKDKLIRQI